MVMAAALALAVILDYESIFKVVYLEMIFSFALTRLLNMHFTEIKWKDSSEPSHFTNFKYIHWIALIFRLLFINIQNYLAPNSINQ